MFGTPLLNKVSHGQCMKRSVSPQCPSFDNQHTQRKASVAPRPLEDLATECAPRHDVSRCRTRCRVSLNGASTPKPAELGSELSSTLAVQQLSEQLKRLTELVQQQQYTINTLETRLAQQPATQHGHSNSTTPLSPFQAQASGFGDRRLIGGFDARYHSTSSGATPKDYRVLPDRIFLVRHAESEGNANSHTYAHIPDSKVPLTARGREQAKAAGLKIRDYIEQRNSHSKDYKLFFYTSPYMRSLQTYEYISQAFEPHQITGVQEEVQLREQDFGNFQDPEGKRREKADRLRFGRFYYRFPDGESGADVYDRLTIFEDHLIRDINAGRFAGHHNLVLVTHGLALRIFLMRWFHWTVDQFLSVFNPDNAEPLVLERSPSEQDARPGGPVSWVHTKALYHLAPESMQVLRGLTQDMCRTDHTPRRPRRVQDPFAVEPGLITVSSGDDDSQREGSVWGDPCDVAHRVPGVCGDDRPTVTDMTSPPPPELSETAHAVAHNITPLVSPAIKARSQSAEPLGVPV